MHQILCLDKGMKRWEKIRFSSLLWAREELETTNRLPRPIEEEAEKTEYNERKCTLISLKRFVSFEEEEMAKPHI